MKVKARQKTIKIGEVSYYGIWKASVSGDRVTIQGIDWDSKEIQEERSFKLDQKANLQMYMEDRMTCYYAGKFMDWIYQ